VVVVVLHRLLPHPLHRDNTLLIIPLVCRQEV
jgi:hypothetical protein